MIVRLKLSAIAQMLHDDTKDMEVRRKICSHPLLEYRGYGYKTLNQLHKEVIHIREQNLINKQNSLRWCTQRIDQITKNLAAVNRAAEPNENEIFRLNCDLSRQMETQLNLTAALPPLEARVKVAEDTPKLPDVKEEDIWSLEAAVAHAKGPSLFLSFSLSCQCNNLLFI